MANKNWDNHVVQAEMVARTPGFRHLRDMIVARADVSEDDVVVDVGAGTGLLTLELAPAVARVWAIDISASMVDYLRTKAASAAADNVDATVASAVSLPLVDDSADVVVSNYCYHHLTDAEKELAIAEVRRVLRPGGRFVFGDMMFRLGGRGVRDREVVVTKARAMVARGPAGVLRLVKNGARLLARRWEHPAPAEWWERALREAGFVDVQVELLDHEGAVASARVPAGAAAPRAGALASPGDA